jgi:hypothetical protein
MAAKVVLIRKPLTRPLTTVMTLEGNTIYIEVSSVTSCHHQHNLQAHFQRYKTGQVAKDRSGIT